MSREATIRYAVPNLRQRWHGDLANYTDDQVAELYEMFSMSDEAGNNDERFPDWFPLLDNAS